MSDLLKNILETNQVQFVAIVFPRMLVTVFLCSIIGIQREHMHRPAGIRTHVLVGVAAALVMCTSEYVMVVYEGIATFDPTRLGAQVISGIGFLGAGTILKDGFTVKGLTTAATLWAVACVGLAVGCGFYSGGVIATAVIYATLHILKNFMENNIAHRALTVELEDKLTIGELKEYLGKVNIQVQYVEVPLDYMGDKALYRIFVYMEGNRNRMEESLESIRKLDGVSRIFEE